MKEVVDIKKKGKKEEKNRNSQAHSGGCSSEEKNRNSKLASESFKERSKEKCCQRILKLSTFILY